MKKFFALSALVAAASFATAQDYSNPSFVEILSYDDLEVLAGETVFGDSSDGDDSIQLAITGNDVYFRYGTGGFTENFGLLTVNPSDLSVSSSSVFLADFESTHVDGDGDIGVQQGFAFVGTNIVFGDDRESGSFGDNEIHVLDVSGTPAVDEIVAANATLNQIRDIEVLSGTTVVVAADDDFGDNVENIVIVDTATGTISGDVDVAALLGETNGDVEVEGLAVIGGVVYVLDTAGNRILEITDISGTPSIADVTPAAWTSLTVEDGGRVLEAGPNGEWIITDATNIYIWDGSASTTIALADISAGITNSYVQPNDGSGLEIYDSNSGDAAFDMILSNIDLQTGQAAIVAVRIPASTSVNDWMMF